MDSYQKYSNDFWKAYMEFYLKDVAAADLDEVKVAFSVVVSHLDYADNFRIYRLKDRAAFIAAINDYKLCMSHRWKVAGIIQLQVCQ